MGGLLLKTVGWRVIAVSGAVYATVYMYERLTWTNQALSINIFGKAYRCVLVECKSICICFYQQEITRNVNVPLLGEASGIQAPIC